MRARAAGMRDSWRSCHLRSGGEGVRSAAVGGAGRAEVPAKGVFLGELGTLSLYSYS